jgi:hypothetical protein
MHGRPFFLVLPMLACACEYNPLLPDTRTPADFARNVTPRCAGFTEDAAAPLLSASAVDSVEPSYSHVQSGPGDREARLRGARIHVRPLPGFSPESIARSLECHESRVVLGATAPAADDPYSLAGHWLDIDVTSAGDGFVVRVEPQERAASDAAREILARAKRFTSTAGKP